MRDFNRRNKKRFDKDDFGGRAVKRDFERKDMHGAICDRCGRRCEVPFRPSGSKPVYCSDCFRKNEHNESGEKPGQSSQELEQINLKLDKILRALNIR